ncbi:hypothetical protein [Nocardia sp. NPDC004260]
MSHGQKPRVRTFFPRMKVRRPHRPRPWMVVLWDEHFQPIWWTRRNRGKRKVQCAYFYCGPADGVGHMKITGIPGGAS